MSRIYCVVLDDWPDTDEQIEGRVRGAYEGCYYHVPDRGVFLIDTDDSAKEVAIALGIRPESDDGVPDAAGIVFSVNGQYSGYTYEEMWDWLQERTEPDGWR